MDIPAFTVGNTREVLRQTRLRLTMIRQGASWDEAMNDRMVPLAGRDQLLVIGGPARELASGEHAQLYLPLEEIVRQSPTTGQGRFPASFRERAFRSALGQPWSTLGLHGDLNGQSWVRPSARREPFIAATLRFWDLFTGVGERYSVGVSWGQSLWACSRSLHFVLASVGVPAEVLRRPLGDGLGALLARYRVAGAAAG